MKRILSILLILILTFSTVGEAFAADIADTASSEEVVSDETLPDDFEYEDPLPPEVQITEQPVVNTALVSTGFMLTWTQVENADGYKVFYQYTDSGKWFRYTTKDSPTSLKSTFNINRKYGKFNFYIEAFNQYDASIKSEVVSAYWLKPVALTSTLREQNSLSLSWDPVEQAEGYEAECCSNRFFSNPELQEISSADPCEITFSQLSDQAQYYARIRAYYTADNGELTYSPWTYSENATVSVNASIKRLTYSGKVLELGAAAKQTVGYYDTLQGGCCIGDYGYFVLYNRNKEKCKIAKFDLTTGKCLKVSAVLPIAHGNDLTYNPDKNIIVAVHSTENGKKVTIINPETLKIKSTKIIRIDESLPGMSESRRASFKGIGAIAYNEQHKQYVARIKTLNDLLFLDSNLNPVRYARLTKENKQIFQGMHTSGDFVLVGQSFKKSSDWNLISVYDWNGNYVSTINIKKGYELECLFNSDEDYYAGFYTSYYKTYYVNAIKTVKVKNKNGKYVKKLVKYKKKKKKLMRDNYIYKLNRF